MQCQLFISPFEGNNHSDEDWATDTDVIERVEKLGEEESIELASVRKGPMEDPGHAIVEQTEDKEDVIEAGKDNEEVVKGVLHVFWREDINWEGVAKDSKDCNRDLKTVEDIPPSIHHICLCSSLFKNYNIIQNNF